MAAQGLVGATEFVPDDTVHARVAVERRREERLPGLVGIAGVQVAVAEHELEVLAQRRTIRTADVGECLLAQGDDERRAFVLRVRVGKGEHEPRHIVGLAPFGRHAQARRHGLHQRLVGQTRAQADVEPPSGRLLDVAVFRPRLGVGLERGDVFGRRSRIEGSVRFRVVAVLLRRQRQVSRARVYL